MASYEFVYGVKKRSFLIFLSLIPLVMLFLHFFLHYVDGLREGFVFSHSIYYHLGKILYGMRPAGNIMEVKYREVPLQWLVIPISYLMIINGYISEERQNRIENITKYGSYRRWWMKKVQWFIAISVFYFMIVGFLLLLEVKAEAMVKIPFHVEYVNSEFDTYTSAIIIDTVIFYIMNALLLGVFQMCLELKIQGMIAFIISVGVLFSEMFMEGVLLPCHLGMIIRNGEVVGDVVLSNGLIMVELLCVIVGMVVGGKICKNGF